MNYARASHKRLIPFYLPIVATASLEKADRWIAIVDRTGSPRAAACRDSRSSDISIPARGIRYLYLRININKRPARAVLTLMHTVRSRALSVSFASKDRSLWNIVNVRSYGCFSLLRLLLEFILFDRTKMLLIRSKLV